ncbi:hypothetical protein [Falsirhodobacter sp. alg1]|nr:hypothetical protein [Falsirhodobacter sp. alg1]
MLRTITIGSCISVQGLFVSDMPDGKMIVQVGEKSFVGRPVSSERVAAA